MSIRIKARGLDGRQRQQTADQRDLYIYLFTIIAQGFNSWSDHSIIRILFSFYIYLFFSNTLSLQMFYDIHKHGVCYTTYLLVSFVYIITKNTKQIVV